MPRWSNWIRQWISTPYNAGSTPVRGTKLVDKLVNMIQNSPMNNIVRCKIKKDWWEADKTGIVLFAKPAQDHNGMDWTAVLWDNEEDPTFYKTRGLDTFEVEDENNN